LGRFSNLAHGSAQVPAFENSRRPYSGHVQEMPDNTERGDPVPLIFISHSSADRDLAELLGRHIEAGGPDVRTFVASRAGDIRADTEWLRSVEKALREAEAYVILLTANSVQRPWVSFETGAAWFSHKTCILVRAGGLPPEEVPLPLSTKQLYALDEVEGARAVFCALSL